MSIKCSGREAVSGRFLELAGTGVIQSAEELISDPGTGRWLAPGLIDIQVNGYAGADYCQPSTTHEAIERSLAAQFACGVTRIFPTVITGGRTEMLAALRNLASARRTLPHGRALEGYHVEGPHISPLDGPRGAHPKSAVRAPDTEEFERWQEAAEGRVKLVTLSAEWPEAPRYIEYITGRGVVAAIGHQQATEQQIKDAVSAGATLSTHLGNGAHSTLPRHPNYLWQQLAEDRLAASLICDGIHLGADFMTVAVRAKGVERAVLITDALAPAGCPPGFYTIGEVEVELREGGRATVRGSERLAGSVLKMHQGVERLMRICGLSLAEAITMATRNPARVGRIEHRQRGLQPGERADVVEFTFDEKTKTIEIQRTWLDGEVVFEQA
jgi:N-acetylglucosamine-6-phosphate deacetylase